MSPTRFLHENALNPFVYPSLLRMEQEVVAVAADLFGTDPQSGNHDLGRNREHLPRRVHGPRGRPGAGCRPARAGAWRATAHPAFTKAAHYLGVHEVRVPVGADLRADVSVPWPSTSAVTHGLRSLVGSAPCYPYGVIDPIAEHRRSWR